MTPQDRYLSQELRMLARSGPQEASPGLERFLLEEFRREKQRRRTADRWRWSAIGTVAAAILALAVLIRPTGWKTAGPDSTSQIQAETLSLDSQDPADQFYVLPEAESLAPLDYGTVVRMELPRSSLAVLGLPVNEERFGERVEAEVLVGQDGIARAVRFLE